MSSYSQDGQPARVMFTALGEGAFSQDGRPARVTFDALEEDDPELFLLGFTGVEELSQPFSYRLRLFSERPLSPPAKYRLLQSPAVLALQLPSGADREIHGLVSRIAFKGQEASLFFYEAELAAWPWFLSLWRNSRIFQNLSVPAIVTQVFKDRNFADFEFRLSTPEKHLPREYCVQYRETDLTFVSRLLEDEGIFYWFEHTGEKHVMVLMDSTTLLKAHPDFPGAQLATRSAHGEDVITSITLEDAVAPGTVQLRDFDYLQRLRPLETTYMEFLEFEAEGPARWGEVYDYPGGYATREHGEWRAQLEYEQRDVARIGVVSGESNCRGFQTGYTFKLENHQRTPYAAESYTLLRVEHACTAGDYRAWDSAKFEYRNHFLARAAGRPFVPARDTPRPTVRGTQTALVVGPEGEEIWTDKHGRVKVQFFWDREGERDENSSCWVRVATPWAGRGWGAVHIPRIGQEVVVDFVEGDPDHPLIIGSVYSADNPVPYGLPDNKTQSGIKSRSSKGGSDQNFNELRFEDKKGSEQVYLHAERDMTTLVENDQATTVKNNRTVSVEVDHTITTKKNHTLTVTEGDYKHEVKTGKATTTVKQAIVLKSEDSTISETAKEAFSITSESAAINLTADTEIKLVVGDASIVMKKDGTITIRGQHILIDGGQSLKASADKVEATAGNQASLGVSNQKVTCNTTKVEISGAAINSSAIGMHEITGAVVKIN